ncbi:MAG: hypothetical protein ACOVVK_17900 [Elsteraceae bacterium]
MKEPNDQLIRTSTVIPEDERWLHEPAARERLAQAITWAETNSARSDNAEELLAKLDDAD